MEVGAAIRSWGCDRVFAYHAAVYRCEKPMVRYLAANAIIAAMILSGSPARACRLNGPFNPSHAQAASTVVIGHIENYEIVLSEAAREACLLEGREVALRSLLKLKN